MAYTVMACIIMAYILMAYIVIVMASLTPVELTRNVEQRLVGLDVGLEGMDGNPIGNLLVIVTYQLLDRNGIQPISC